MNNKFVLLLSYLALTPVVFADYLVPLRELTHLAQNIDSITRIIVFLLALVIFVIAVLAYKKSQSQRLAFVGLAFFLFTVKWGLKVFDLFVSSGNFLGDASQNVIELIILACLAIAIFRK